MSLTAPFVPRAVDGPAERERLSGSEPDEVLTLSRWIAGILLRWRQVLAVLALTWLATILALVFVPPVYRSQSSFVANSSSARSSASMGVGLGGAALAGMAAELGMGTTDPSESPLFYGNLLTSRELLTRLLHSRFPDPRTTAPADSVPLLDIVRVKDKDSGRRLEKALDRLRDNISTRNDLKTSMVTVIVAAEWPDVAAGVANSATALVKEFNLEQRQSRGRARREFLDRRLDEARQGLAAAEARAREFYEINRQFQGSPQLRQRETEIRRQVDMAADLFLTLQRERESSLLAEVNDAALITVVDTAIPSRRAVWPRPFLALATATVVGLLFGFVIAGLSTVIAHWARQDPASASSLRQALLEARDGVGRLIPGTRSR